MLKERIKGFRVKFLDKGRFHEFIEKIICPSIVGAVPLYPPFLRKDYYVESHD